MPTADRHGILHNIQKTRRNILRIENAQPTGDDDPQPGRMRIDPVKLSRRRATAKRARAARRRQRQGRGG